MGLINRPTMCHRSFGYADTYLMDVVRAKAMLLDELTERVDDSLHCSHAGIELEPDAHDFEVAAETARDFFRLRLIGEDFQQAALAFDNCRPPREAELRQEAGWITAAAGNADDTALHFASSLIVFHSAAGMHAGDTEGMENLPFIQAQQSCRCRHRAEGRPDAVAVEASLAG